MPTRPAYPILTASLLAILTSGAPAQPFADHPSARSTDSRARIEAAPLPAAHAADNPDTAETRSTCEEAMRKFLECIATSDKPLDCPVPVECARVGELAEAMIDAIGRHPASAATSAQSM